ncbi:MAG: site-2 protease family protein [Planctomycetaceae bacterium]|nr:site-2 protease family protein [Planctomycetaceae bacterium]
MSPLMTSDSNQKHPPEILIYPDGRTVEVHDVPSSTSRKVQSNRLFYWAVGLFLATCLSTWYVGHTRYQDGFGFMIPVMAILFAHEMGHYVTSRFYRSPVTPPLFIPMPFSPLGTFGALIIKKGSREDRRALFDIAIAGPLAGLVIALPVCIYGAMIATAVPREQVPSGEIQFIAPRLMSWIVIWVRGEWPPGTSMESAVLDAGWVGIFITALNLIPIGQLDGGHILYTLIGKKAHRVAEGLIIFSLAHMVVTGNGTYLLMVLLIMMMGPYHPPTSNDRAPLGWFRIVLGWLTLSFILVGFTPTPIIGL